MSASPVIAILCSDIHLSHKAPLARSAEPDWYAAMDRQLAKLRFMQTHHQCPVIIAGDIFDKWSNTPELVNFAMDALPKECYAIPGQHDLRHHSLSDINVTSYWTLVKAGKIISINPVLAGMFKNPEAGIKVNRDLVLYGFPWGSPLHECPFAERDIVSLAVVHAYCWSGASKYKDAPKANNVRKHMKKLKGYSAAVFGDNHKGFLHITPDGTSVLNCGTFFKRKADEKDYEPRVGLLRRDGSIEPYSIDCGEDKFIDVDEALAVVQKGLDLVEFMADLGQLRNGVLDFRQAISEYIQKHGIGEAVAKIITRAIEG